MSGTRAIAPAERENILDDSISHGRQTVLTRQTVEGWRTYRSTFASGSRASESIVVRVAEVADRPLPTAMQPGETLGVTFRLGHKKCMFSSVLQGVEQRKGSALVGLRWPDNLHQLQRRAYERVSPPSGSVVAVRFWDEAETSGDAGATRKVRHGQLEDISAGGIRIKVAGPKGMELGRPYRCVFSPRPGAPPVILEGTLRHREAGDEGRMSLGLQFIGLETTAEGRHTLDRLARIVNQFQNANRRTRS